MIGRIDSLVLVLLACVRELNELNLAYLGLEVVCHCVCGGRIAVPTIVRSSNVAYTWVSIILHHESSNFPKTTIANGISALGSHSK